MYLYELHAHLERGWWVIEAPDVGSRTQAPTLATLDVAARHLIATRLGIDPELFRVDIRVHRHAPQGPVSVRWSQMQTAYAAAMWDKS